MSIPLLRTSERLTFRRCPQKWWWAWREGLRTSALPSDALWFGTGIHLAFAKWYIPGRKRGVDPRETWDKYCTDEVRFIKTRLINERKGEFFDEEKYVEAGKLGEIMLANYLDVYGHDENWDVIAPEQTFQVLIPGPDGKPIVRYAGTFDGVYRDLADGFVKLMEHKTAAQIYTGHLALDDQAGSYWAIATHTLREQGLIKQKERIKGITYNFLRKGTPDPRPQNAKGEYLNKATKQHYIDALLNHLMNDFTEKELKKFTVAQLEETAKDLDIKVEGEVSKVQPAPLLERVWVTRSARERRRQLERIAAEAQHMAAMRSGLLPIFKNTDRDCKFCEFYEMCELEESAQSEEDWKEFRDAVFIVKDPYEDHRKAA